MNTDATPAEVAPAASSGRMTASLPDDTATNESDFIGKEYAPPAAEAAPATPKPEPEAKPDADELTLELSRRTRDAQASHKANQAKQKELDGHIAKHRALADVLGLAKTDPLAFIEKLADAAGLDVDTAIEAYTVRKSGGKRDLSAEERIARMEREREQQTKESEAQRAERESAEQKAAGEKALASHTASIKSLASSSENFPLFSDPDDIESNALAAFDLMVMAHEAGKPMSHAAAVSEIERTLRADTERKATRIGLRKTEALPPTAAPAATPTAPAPAALPRPTQASAAPPADDNRIRTDEEIAADWSTSFQR